MRAQDGAYHTWFRREGANLPAATGKTPSFGFGIFAPADAVRLAIPQLPGDNPMVAEEGVIQPSAEEIAAATGGGATTSQSTTSSRPSPTTAPSEEHAGGDDAAAEGSGPNALLILLVVLAVVVVGALAVMAHRRSTRSTTGADAVGPDPTHRAGQRPDSTTFDNDTATDDVAARGKKDGHGEGHA